MISTLLFSSLPPRHKWTPSMYRDHQLRRKHALPCHSAANIYIIFSHSSDFPSSLHRWPARSSQLTATQTLVAPSNLPSPHDVYFFPHSRLPKANPEDRLTALVETRSSESGESSFINTCCQRQRVTCRTCFKCPGAARFFVFFPSPISIRLVFLLVSFF